MSPKTNPLTANHHQLVKLNAQAVAEISTMAKNKLMSSDPLRGLKAALSAASKAFSGRSAGAEVA